MRDDGNGFDVSEQKARITDRVRALCPHTKILFSSVFTEKAIVHQGVLDEGVALLQKPYAPSTLAQKLREVLDQRAARKPDTAQQTFAFSQSSAAPATVEYSS